ncbi:hypothetical protein [Actinomadura sp. 9N407]|uniref:hypothetical protein n=1 Tax=Actinomadura sp. 9N407 TaxID=3375154 RepID=UPI00378E8398
MDKVLKQCRWTWIRIGVSAEAIEDMAAELRTDLEAAVFDGRDPRSFVGGDVAGFARAWASARGAVPLRRRAGRVAVAAILGAVPGGVMGLFILFGLSSDLWARTMGAPEVWAYSSEGPYAQQTQLDLPAWLVIALYALAAAVAWAGSLAAVSAALRFQADAARRATVRAAAVTLPPTGVLGAVAIQGYSVWLGKEFDVATLVGSVLIAAAMTAAAVALNRMAVVSRYRQAADSGA